MCWFQLSMSTYFAYLGFFFSLVSKFETAKPYRIIIADTLECLIKGQARLFISKKMSSVSIDFNVVKYFFHPARLFGLLHKRAGVLLPLPVY